MASSGTGCLKWNIDGPLALHLFHGKLRESRPDVIVEWFETDVKTETNRMMSSEGLIIVQLPIPETKDVKQRKIMAARLQDLFDKVSKDCSTIGFEIGQHKTLAAGELVDMLLTSWTCLATDIQYRRGKLDTLVICAPNPVTFSIAQRLCEAHFSGSKRENSTGCVTKPVDKSRPLTVKVIQGCLEECIADVYVCTISPNCCITGKSAEALNIKSKYQLEKDLRDKCRGRKLKISEVAVVKRSGDLRCKHVIAGAFDIVGYKYQDYKYKSENDFYQGTLHDFIVNCLHEVEKLGHSTVAFPAIAVGCCYPVKIIAEQMFKSVQTFPSNGTINTVTFVIYKLDNNILEEFKKAEKTFGKTSTTYKATASAQCVKRKTSSLTNSKMTDFKTPEDEDKNVTTTQLTPVKLNKDRRLDFSSSLSSSTASFSQGARQKTFSRQSSLRCPKTFNTQNGIKVTIHQCNVVDAPAECICMPATKDKLAGNVAHAINTEAGKDLSRTAKEKLEAENRFQVGEVCDTGVGKIRCKRIVHTVVPEWEMYKPFSETNVLECESTFCKCILNSLIHAEKLGLKSLAFSPMSVGLRKVPNDLCAAMYVKAVVDYDRLSGSPLKEIYFVDKDENEIHIIKGAFHDVLQMSEGQPSCYNRAVHIKRDNSTSNTGRYNVSTSGGRSGRAHVTPGTYESSKSSDVDRDPSNPKMIINPSCHFSKPPNKVVSTNEFTCWFNKKQKLYVYTDDITSLWNIDLIVCSEKPNGKGEGKLAKALGDKFGSSYKKSKETEFKRYVKRGDVIVCSSKQITSKPKWIAHAVLYLKEDCNGEKDRKKKVEDIFTSIFDQASAKGCKSIALPVLGSGKGNVDPEYYTERLFESLFDFCVKTPTDIFVHLVNIKSSITEMAITTVKKAASKAASKSPNLNLPKARSEPRTPERPKYSTRKDSTNKHNGTIDKENRESKQPDPSSNIPAATSSRRARQPIQDTTEQTEAEIPPKPNTVRTGNVQIYIDDDDDDEEVPSKSKERDKDSNERTINSEERDNGSNSGYSEDDDDNSYVQRSDSDEENDEGASCQAKDSKPNKTEEICVICMETVKKPRTLLCGHVFCEDCIEQQFTYKEACPTCGRVVGTIEGDQPDGTMTITIDEFTHCAGFEREGQIIITYSFENGKQGPSHPNPGAIYKGITRKAFLPKNEHGKRICKMLWVAFERRLVFTVGSSRTTGKEGVITWNDIHHKTDPKPNSQFGYPDDSYLDRVTDELKAKGVTEDDIVDTSFELLLRRGWRPRR